MPTDTETEVVERDEDRTTGLDGGGGGSKDSGAVFTGPSVPITIAYTVRDPVVFLILLSSLCIAGVFSRGAAVRLASLAAPSKSAFALLRHSHLIR